MSFLALLVLVRHAAMSLEKLSVSWLSALTSKANGFATSSTTRQPGHSRLSQQRLAGGTRLHRSAPPFATDHLQCGYIDVRPGKFREDIGNGTGAVVAVNEQRRTFAQLELGLLCGGDKSRAVFGDEFELRSPWSVLVAPECSTTRISSAMTPCFKPVSLGVK
jgi:hypothetical protein